MEEIELFFKERGCLLNKKAKKQILTIALEFANKKAEQLPQGISSGMRSIPTKKIGCAS